MRLPMHLADIASPTCTSPNDNFHFDVFPAKVGRGDNLSGLSLPYDLAVSTTHIPEYSCPSTAACGHVCASFLSYKCQHTRDFYSIFAPSTWGGRPKQSEVNCQKWACVVCLNII